MKIYFYNEILFEMECIIKICNTEKYYNIRIFNTYNLMVLMHVN